MIALVDTGSNISMIHPSACLQDCNVEPITNKLHVYGANNGEVKTNGSTIISFTLAETQNEWTHTFVIANISSVDAILGNDFLYHNRANLILYE